MRTARAFVAQIPIVLSLIAGCVAPLAADPEIPRPARTAAAATPSPTPGVQRGIPPPNSPPPAGVTEEQLLTEIGWLVGSSSGLSEIGLDERQETAVLSGARMAIEKKASPLPVESARAMVTTYMREKMQAVRAAAQKQAQDREAAYFADLRTKGVASTPDGLYYEIINPGSERKPTLADTITVNYTGRLTDGTVFDSNAAKGGPATFRMGRMIRGWNEGLTLIGAGGKIKLYIPFSLAYGPSRQASIPAFSTLEFDVELVGVTPPPLPPNPASVSPASTGPGPANHPPSGRDVTPPPSANPAAAPK